MDPCYLVQDLSSSRFIVANAKSIQAESPLPPCLARVFAMCLWAPLNKLGEEFNDSCKASCKVAENKVALKVLSSIRDGSKLAT
jgi:hypothetical protein